MKAFFQLWCVENNPSIQCTMINYETTLCHHFFNVSIAKRIRTVPANALKNVGFRCVAAFESDLGLLSLIGFLDMILLCDEITSLDATEPLYPRLKMTLYDQQNVFSNQNNVYTRHN
jgi:hypothetical protein